MFKFSSLKKYGAKLPIALEKRYGEKKYYSASQVRATVYQCDFNPKFLPLAYILFLEPNTLKNVLFIEFPDLNVCSYKQEISDYLTKKRYTGNLHALM